MTFELNIIGGRTITADAWRQRARSLGLEVEFHPGFVMESHSDLVLVRFQVASPSLFGGGKRWGASGKRVGAFEFEIERFGPGAGPEVTSKVDERIEELTASGAPSIILEHWREKRLRLEQPNEQSEDGAQRVYFRTGKDRSFADYLVQVVLAAAFALACDGALEDPQDWGRSWPPDPGQIGFGHTRRGESGITDALARQLRHGPLPGAVAEIDGPPRLVLAGALAARPWAVRGSRSRGRQSRRRRFRPADRVLVRPQLRFCHGDIIKVTVVVERDEDTKASRGEFAASDLSEERDVGGVADAESSDAPRTVEHRRRDRVQNARAGTGLVDDGEAVKVALVGPRRVDGGPQRLCEGASHASLPLGLSCGGRRTLKSLVLAMVVSTRRTLPALSYI